MRRHGAWIPIGSNSCSELCALRRKSSHLHAAHMHVSLVLARQLLLLLLLLLHRRQVSGMTYRRPGMSMASTPVDEYAPLVTDVETIRAIVRAAASS